MKDSGAGIDWLLGNEEKIYKSVSDIPNKIIKQIEKKQYKSPSQELNMKMNRKMCTTKMGEGGNLHIIFNLKTSDIYIQLKIKK